MNYRILIDDYLERRSAYHRRIVHVPATAREFLMVLFKDFTEEDKKVFRDPQATNNLRLDCFNVDIHSMASSCPRCRVVHTDMSALWKEDKEVRKI